MTMKQKGDARKAREALEEMAKALINEGYAVFSPSQNRMAVVRSFKIAMGCMPKGTEDLEYAAHVDWVTDNVILKVYSRARKTGAAVALIGKYVHDKAGKHGYAA